MQTNQTEVSAVVAVSNVVESAASVLIPFSKLVRSPKKNVRKNTRGLSLNQLAESIAKMGVVQNLIVVLKDAKKGIYEVIGGGRRYGALDLLVKAKRIDRSFLVPCVIRPVDQATALSLTENFQHEPMHRADEFEGFAKLVSEGKSVEDIAAAFGLSVQTVNKRLKLAAVEPSFIKMYRNEQINFDILMALALTDDHDLQRNVWANLPQHSRTAAGIRRQITHQDMSAKDAKARFVGLDAYVAAGGIVRSDIFSPESEWTWSNAALVSTLAQQKLERTALRYLEAGWSWAEVNSELESWEILRLPMIKAASKREMTEAEATQLASMLESSNKLDTAIEAADDYSARRPLEDQLAVLEVRIEEFGKQFDVFTSDEMGRSGVYVYMSDEGELATVVGVIRAVESEGIESGAGVSSSTPPAPKERPIHSDKLMGMLSANRTIALQATIEQQPNLALVVLAHRLAMNLVHDSHKRSAVIASMEDASYAVKNADPAVEQTAAWKHMESAQNKWAALLPQDDDEAFAWLVDQPQTTVIELLAYCTARSVNAITRADTIDVGDYLAERVSLDMHLWWKPTADTYFNHVTKARIAEVVHSQISEAEAHRILPMKKTDAAHVAERLLEGKGWLPGALTVR